MPVDTDCSLPNGLPIAMTQVPTLRLSESPMLMGVSVSPEVSLILMTARSLDWSEPTSSASRVSPLSRVTVRLVAPETTW